MFVPSVGNKCLMYIRRACKDLMEENFRVSTNSVRVLRQLTMGRVLINFR